MPEIKEPIFILPLDQMAVGNSIFIPTLKTAEMIYSVDCRAKDVGIRVKCFVMQHDGVLGVRAWRIK
jgi:hypothetical protein